MGWGGQRGMVDTSRSSVWVDSGGRTRQTILRGNATLAPVEAALITVSNADTQRCWEGPTQVNATPATTNATYPTVADYAVLIYQDAGGDLVYITLVAPQSSIFMADQETVNPAAIAAVSTAVIGLVTTGGGGVVTAYVGGFRRRSGREYQ
jgi:hypothetical protein